MKKKLSYIAALAGATILATCSLVACGGGDAGEAVKKVIEQAQNMTRDELYQKAMEEVQGKEFIVVANSSRMKDAAPAWKTWCQEHFSRPDFEFTFSSTQPKNNQIFSQIKSDVDGATHNISMTLIQDGSQIASKMTSKGYLLNYIPKEWAGNKAADGEPLALQSLNKVFCFNEGADKSASYKNCWDFALNVATQFMAPSSEPVGQNFMYMLTQEKYAAYVKEGYDALDDAAKKKVDDTIASKDTGIPNLLADNTFCPNAKYSLAWIYLFLKSYTRVTDDGPIANNLTVKANKGQAGLIVYSKFRSTTESETVSNEQINIAAYQDGYKGFGGYMYKHYLQILKTSPLPWTSCALIHFMVDEKEGFQPWGKDMGGYSSNPTVQANFDHSQDGYVGGVNKYPCKNDKGYDWWTTNGKLVLEDGTYCSQVAPVLSDWIAYL